MPVTLEQHGLDKLSPADRLELVGRLWDSLDAEAFVPPDWHIRELDKRRAAAEADPSAGVPWEEFKARWLGRP
ncbi:MAG: addiction module protein [Gemmataceae bacterium]|nr:addiction module protein [Gemmataceae bacterium]